MLRRGDGQREVGQKRASRRVDRSMGSEEGEEVALGSPNDWKAMKREDGRYQTNGG